MAFLINENLNNRKSSFRLTSNLDQIDKKIQYKESCWPKVYFQTQMFLFLSAFFAIVWDSKSIISFSQAKNWIPKRSVFSFMNLVE